MKRKMYAKKGCFLASEVDEGDLEDVVKYNKYRMSKNWHRDSYYLGLYATINGYHKFRIKPNENSPLQCVREPENPYDVNAIKIVDTSEGTVGRMPRSFCSMISRYIDSGEIVHATAFYKGNMSHGVSWCGKQTCNKARERRVRLAKNIMAIFSTFRE